MSKPLADAVQLAIEEFVANFGDEDFADGKFAFDIELSNDQLTDYGPPIFELAMGHDVYLMSDLSKIQRFLANLEAGVESTRGLLERV